MRDFQADSLKRNLTLTFVWLWVASALAATLVAFWLAGRSAQISFDRILKDDALALATQIHWEDTGPIFAADPHTADYLIFDSLSPSRFMVIDETGRKLVGNAVLELPKDAEHRLSGAPLFFDSITDAGTLRVVAIRLEHKPSKVRVWVVVGESQAKRSQLSRELAAAIFLPAIGLTIFIVPLLFAGIKYGLAPANAISTAVARRGINDLSAIPISQVPDEMRGLITHINDLLKRLQDAVAHERRFISDAAHQLRTPLAGIKLLVDDLVRTNKASPSDPPNLEVLAELGAAASRVTLLIKQLLTLARTEGVNTIETVDTNMAELVQSLVLQWTPVFESANKTLHVQNDLALNTERAFKTNPTLLSEILNNILDNALNYGGEIVQIIAKVHNRELLLGVLDNGSSVGADDVEKMLTPFWRGKDVATHGVGLGLPIAHKTCSLLGAELQIQTRPKVQGTQVTVSFSL